MGLLTSTVRTFIQEGVTTEYATQVVGTTLNNGRLYAQVLAKSSRVLYDGDGNVKSHLNDIIPGKGWVVDDIHDVDGEFIKNTDDWDDQTLIYPSKSTTAQNAFVVFPTVLVSSKSSSSASQNSGDKRTGRAHYDDINVHKVRPPDNLPTYTIRNEFSPSGFAFDDTESEELSVSENTPVESDSRFGKLLNQNQQLPKRNLISVTYYGFADFTTVVGDTVIVFSPSTAAPVPNAHVTSIKGEATLANGIGRPSQTIVEAPLHTRVNELSHDYENMVDDEITEQPQYTPQMENKYYYNVEEKHTTQQIIESTTPLENIKMEEGEVDNNDENQENEDESETPEPNNDNVDEEDEDEGEDENNEKEKENNEKEKENVEEDDEGVPETTEESHTTSPEEMKIVEEMEISDEVTEIQPSEVISSMPAGPLLSTPSDEDIRKILASLAGLQAIQSVSTSSESKEVSEQLQIQPDTQILGGVTTIFTDEDDPFASIDHLTPHTIVESEENVTEKYAETTTEKTIQDSTTIEVTTEHHEEDENDELETITHSIKDIEDSTTVQAEIQTQPEESEGEKEEEEEEVTTPTSEDNNTIKNINIISEEKLPLCTDAIRLIPSTTHKTYTQLTTFFIPIGDSSTSTSVESNIVASSEISYHLPTDCRYDNIIKPTNIEILGESTSTLLKQSEEAISRNPRVNEDEEFVTEGITTETPTTEKPVDEIELIYKTLYTTYTYLTTFFQESTSSISSRKEVVTNVVSSTLNPSLLQTDEAVADLVASMTQIKQNGLRESDLLGIDNILNTISPTATDQKYLMSTENVKTYYTTYTYFTTIFVEGETEISSRTEVYTNYVSVEPSSSINIDIANEIVPSSVSYSTMVRTSVTSDNIDDEIKMVTDVQSSTSDGDRKVVESRQPRYLDDQISSESNTEEIIPAPLLLLQTSFTTYTYFTTMYIGSTSSNILSRLETVTNVVTETLAATQTLPAEDVTLPITYFTTFTYWTTLFRDGSTVTTSREETISNVIEPGATIFPTPHTDESMTSTVAPTMSEPTTYYTTYTYFTTSYVGDETILNSRFETVTNIVEPSTSSEVIPTGRAINFESLNNIIQSDSKIGNIEKPQSTPVLESTISPTGIIFLNEGKIVDADSVSTIIYTTKALGVYEDGVYKKKTESTSSFAIDTVRKSELAAKNTATNEDAKKLPKTGLVRQIDGTIVNDHTTTFYQSKVIGTLIEGRYAQIIESTSSLVVEKTAEPILPSSTESSIIKPTILVAPTPSVVESSIKDDENNDEDNNTEEDDDVEEEDEDGNTRVKSRLTFQTKQRTFTPVIRPFASRNRPTFNPKRKNVNSSSATIITISDVTPTITATPALKSQPGGRFNSRKTSGNNSPINNSRRFSRPSSTVPNGSRQLSSSSGGFGKSSTRGGYRSSSSIISPSSRFGRIRPTLSSERTFQSASIGVTEEPTTYVTDDFGDTTLDGATTEISRRRQNPLLRNRRPQSVGFTTPRPPSGVSVTTRRIPILNRPRQQTTTTPATTTTQRPRPTNRFLVTTNNAFQTRPRPSNSLFPPRGLLRNQQTTTEEPEQDEDLEYEDEESTTSVNDEQRRRKRQIEYGTRSPGYTNRFRRPTPSRNRVEERNDKSVEEVATESPTKPSRIGGQRYQPRQRGGATTQAPARIRPTPASRSQFTLRNEKEPTTTTRSPSFRRPTTSSSSSRRKPTSAPTQSRPKAPRLRTYSSTENNNSNFNTRTSSRASRTRSRSGSGTSRPRNGRVNQEQYDTAYIQPSFDGTITVTHHIPTEVTIPVVNGKVTEYKNIITAKPSTEVLGPKQYSTSNSVIYLTSEVSIVNNNGFTEVTHFLLNETPTTSVTFTPTTIRGRRTSYSHIIPSTIYDVERVVTTVQPQVAANAPLANILLSQLLLGNLQNPLLGIQQQPQLMTIPTTPTTEFITKTTTYVTTVTNSMSTIVPLTFRGKEILTTIVDTAVDVITATEFLTETVVVQPSQQIQQIQQLQLQQQAPQLNSLLLPLLLQQQAQSPILNTQLPNIVDPNTIEDSENESNLNNFDSRDLYEPDDDIIEDYVPKRRAFGAAAKSSVVTLYVSGRRPGEFSTILSTVPITSESNVRKRSAEYIEIEPSSIPTFDNFNNEILPGFHDSPLKSSIDTFESTQSLESVIGDVSKHHDTETLSFLS